jgi:hypothetical protein
MSQVPFDIRLEAAIRGVSQEITQAKNDLSRHALASPPTTPPINEVRALTSLLERRHALLLQRTYPNATVYTQITFGPVMDPDTGRAIPLRGAGARRPDMGVLDGDTLYLVEVKVLNEILDMFPKGSKARGEIEVKLKKSSTFGAQWKEERSLLNRAFKKGAHQAFNGTRVLGTREELLVRTTDRTYGGSHPQVYGNMGDGLPIKAPGSSPGPAIGRVQPIDLQPSPDAIRAAKLNQPVTVTPVKPGSTTAPKPGDLRAIRGVAGPAPNRMVDNRGTPTTPDPAVQGTAGTPPPRRAYEIPSSPRFGRVGFNVRAAMSQGIAQAFQTMMTGLMHASAAAAAERAAESEGFLAEVAGARRNNRAWVLVTAHFAESVSNAGGARHLVFLWVALQVVEAAPGESPQRTLTRLRQSKMPGEYKRPGRDGSRSRGFDTKDWNIVSREMRLYPGEPVEEGISEVDPKGPAYGTRCVVPRLH